ncbi:MAG TPA: hypothetical protein VFY39_13015 [Gammaproteobacteria bacterium]|nr:hypothetical protein [Gammaproteobacteria bacterium]
MGVPEEVLKLVNIVRRLPREDQARILEIVDLLSLASSYAQGQTQCMLGELLGTRLRSKAECVAGVDDVIEYLEQAVYEGDEAPARARFGGQAIAGNA